MIKMLAATIGLFAVPKITAPEIPSIRSAVADNLKRTRASVRTSAAAAQNIRQTMDDLLNDVRPIDGSYH